MNKSDIRPDELRSVPPPEDLSPFVSVFVSRNERVNGEVIRLLPELRSSVQLTLGDCYWVREQSVSSQWRPCSQLALWLPRTQWGYGYAASRVTVYAFGLTPLGFHTLGINTTTIAPNSVVDLLGHSSFGDLVSQRKCHFEQWTATACSVLRRLFAHVDPTPQIPGQAVAILATDGTGAIDKAAEATNLSVRQFRRRFVKSYGVTPKIYQRLVRVDRMLRQLHPAPWERDAHVQEPIAFADQPHATREFKRATGVSPSNYVALKQTGDRTLRSLPANDGVCPPTA